MRRFSAAALAAIAVAAALPTTSSATEPRRAPDCRFQQSSAYESFGRIRVFTADGKTYGCLTDVGRAYRLHTGTLGARSSAMRRAVFGVGDWVGFPARDRSGRVSARAINLRSGRTHAARGSAAISALVVNFDGTLAWIAGTALHAKPAAGAARTLASSDAIDRAFLGLENDQGCAVTWRIGDEQRSSSVHCSRP